MARAQKVTIGVVSARWEYHPKYEYLVNLARHTSVKVAADHPDNVRMMT